MSFGFSVGDFIAVEHIAWVSKPITRVQCCVLMTEIRGSIVIATKSLEALRRNSNCRRNVKSVQFLSCP